MRSSWRHDLKMIKNTSIGGVSKRYANLSGALSQDSALKEQWPGSGSRDCEGLNMHNFLNTCSNGVSEVCILMYAKRSLQ